MTGRFALRILCRSCFEDLSSILDSFEVYGLRNRILDIIPLRETVSPSLLPIPTGPNGDPRLRWSACLGFQFEIRLDSFYEIH